MNQHILNVVLLDADTILRRRKRTAVAVQYAGECLEPEGSDVLSFTNELRG